MWSWLFLLCMVCTMILPIVCGVGFVIRRNIREARRRERERTIQKFAHDNHLTIYEALKMLGED